MTFRLLGKLAKTPFGEVQLVTVEALLPAELEYVLKRGALGPAELARRFAKNGEEHVSRANRRAAVSPASQGAHSDTGKPTPHGERA